MYILHSNKIKALLLILKISAASKIFVVSYVDFSHWSDRSQFSNITTFGHKTWKKSLRPKKNPVYNQNFSVYSRLNILEVNGEKVLAIPKDFFHMLEYLKRFWTFLVLTLLDLTLEQLVQGSIELIGFGLMLDSLTTILVKPHQCPSHQSILLTQEPICENFVKMFWEVAILKISVFLSRPLWIL